MNHLENTIGKAAQPGLQPPVRRAAIWAPLLAVCFAALLIVLGAWRHVQIRAELEQDAKDNAVVTVNVVTVKPDEKPRELILPGNVQAFQSTGVYARTDGYLARWLVDIGDHVEKGQLLAEIETPEIDKEFEQARAQVAQAQSNERIAKVTADRWQYLAQRNVVAKEENDVNQAAYQTSAATLAATQANLERLEQLEDFKKIAAPFAGTITARRVDVGTLVSSGGGASGTLLFNLAQLDPLRIFVYVPQTNAPSIRTGITARLLVPEYPSRDFEGRVVRTAGALDPASRTLLTELEIPNDDGALFAGMYAQVKFTLQEANAPIIIPENAFIFRSEGTQVAIADEHNRIHWQTIQVGRDFGTQMEVLSGLQPNIRVVTNPTDDLREGLEVMVKNEDDVSSTKQAKL
ncbi:MAG: efflux RND transporter periplasmic adaptor subunit [Terrimicrobiaceae bacterium]